MMLAICSRDNSPILPSSSQIFCDSLSVRSQKPETVTQVLESSTGVHIGLETHLRDYTSPYTSSVNTEDRRPLHGHESVPKVSSQISEKTYVQVLCIGSKSSQSRVITFELPITGPVSIDITNTTAVSGVFAARNYQELSLRLQ